MNEKRQEKFPHIRPLRPEPVCLSRVLGNSPADVAAVAQAKQVHHPVSNCRSWLQKALKIKSTDDKGLQETEQENLFPKKDLYADFEMYKFG